MAKVTAVGDGITIRRFLKVRPSRCPDCAQVLAALRHTFIQRAVVQSISDEAARSALFIASR